MVYEPPCERSGWEKREGEMPVGMGEEIVRLAFQSMRPEAWKDWLRAPLLGAVAQGNVSMALALLKAGANSVLEEEESPGGTMMHAAAEGGSAEIARALLDHSAEHDVRAGTQTTPLHVAARKGHAAVARVLLRAGAKTDGGDDDFWGRTPLHEACVWGHHELAADLLMNGAKVNAVAWGRTPLSLAAGNGHVETAKVLMRASADPEYRANWCGFIRAGRTPLVAALRSGHVHVMRQLVADGAKVDVGSVGWTPLCVSMLDRADLSVVHTLIDLGADVNFLGHRGSSPLHLAARTNFALGVKALAEAGADIEARDKHKDTPLHVACRSDSRDAVKALLQLGADTTAVGSINRTPRDMVPSHRAGADKMYALLARAPAIRAWHHRGWIVMLRARRLRARVEAGNEAHTPTAHGQTAGGEGLGQGKHQAGGPRKKSGRVSKEHGPAAAPPPAVRPSSTFARALSLLLGVPDDQVFRSVVLFL